MARKARQKISYVLPLANSPGGHRLGVNGLAVDSQNSLLYSGGRDGVICAWDLNLDLNSARSPTPSDTKPPPPPATTFRQQVQAHTHWINDIVLAQSNQALVSASSDITVKVWKPAAQDAIPPQTIGLHSDYVKVLAVPDSNADWVASGGLDRRICLWDLTGAGQKLSIDVAKDEGGAGLNRDKGSVYALGTTHSILASGGPESNVRVWDPKSGKRVTKFVGHTDNIRDILISEDGTTIMTASSDQTVKVWSVTAGRCMHTLTMHDSSVWSLWSTDPQLSVFYSSDKHGMVARTDTRGCAELDEGLSVAICQEHEGVHKLVQAGDSIWTATSRPTINRWADFDTWNAEAEIPESFRGHRFSVATTRTRMPSTSHTQSPPRDTKKQIPLKHILRMTNTAFFPSAVFADSEPAPLTSGRRATLQPGDADLQLFEPVRSQPECSIEGQNGLIKHIMLNDRKRVLTLDTAGEVLMWDILKCVPIKSFGKRHLEDVQPEVTTQESVANWCSIDTRTGSLAITLEDHTCFDAEMYADELEDDDEVEFKEDQRINLGKWVLRYLFASIITEEVQRDQVYRKQLLNAHRQSRLERVNAPSNIQMPSSHTNGWNSNALVTSSPFAATPKATNGSKSNVTPGLGIALVTPGIFPLSSVSRDTTRQSEDGAGLEKRVSGHSLSRKSVERPPDYFSAHNSPALVMSPNPDNRPVTPSEGQQTDPASSAADESKTSASEDAKDTPSKFGKKFRMNMSFSKMKLGRGSASEKDKPVVVEEKEDAESDRQSTKTDNSRVVEDNFLGTIQKLRFEYQDQLQQHAQQQHAQDAAGGALGASKDPNLESSIAPSMPSETPVLRPPANTKVLIQEDRPEAGGVADLFEGTVGKLRDSADVVEKVAPMWLGDVLLRNTLPPKDIVKVSFVLEPWQGLLPAIATDGNNRLNANRMLRARKILAYVAERIEPQQPQPTEAAPASHDPNPFSDANAAIDDAALKPEEYLDLYCNNTLLSPRMTLATIRTHVWRSGGDVMLYYKANGRKEILHSVTPGTGGSGQQGEMGVVGEVGTEKGEGDEG